MEVMKPITPKPTQVLLTVLLVGLISLACNLLQIPAQAPASDGNGTPQTAPQANAPAGQNTPAADNSQADVTQPDPLDHLLALHSVQIDLGITRPDGSSRSIQISTDKSGNMDLKFKESAPDASNLPKGFDLQAIKTDSELLAVGGKAYVRSDQDPNWMSTPVDDAYPQTLAQELHGMDGPALWLNLLPDGSIQPAGQDTVGGFAVDKYTVYGKVENQVISGTLWEEPQSDALVQAELHVPGALMSPPDQPQPGELKILIKAQKADVPLVVLPPAPPPTAVPTTAP
jgi:hypothetical protein